MAGSRILVVEDSDAIRMSVLAALTAEGFEPLGAADGDGLERVLGEFRPALVILDVMLPGRDGFELLDLIRPISSAAVLMLTARDTTVDRVRGLSGGADDYLVKPFAMVELIARVRAVLRRTAPGGPAIMVGDLLIAEQSGQVARGDHRIELTETEQQILAYLAHQRGNVVSKDKIISEVWGYAGFDRNLVEVHVSSLRRKLERHGPRLIHTVRGRGYRLAESP
ncbi:response regulator transcription factor [Microlunatus speluncae]|uniref:response regulator transcription factor n=1 Tax=Microlunatus speluncae TaxID=2594267 RepID=UPI001FE96E1D|nr:response regulator transcription factor [Microlunatus speluncae]